jgi:flagellar biosynthesis regulator FlaF
MKINIEDYLHKIDTAFQGKEKREIYMTYFMIFAAIFAFSYLLFWDSSFNKFEKTRKHVQSLEQKIAVDRRYLQVNPASKITQLDSEIKSITKQIADMKDTNDYIKSKIETISALIYDERAWGEYIDSISTNAQKHHVKLLNLTNEYTKNESSFGHILDISIVSDGNYKNSLAFINSLEESDLVVDIHDFDLKAEENLHSELNISVWGIRY